MKCRSLVEALLPVVLMIAISVPAFAAGVAEEADEPEVADDAELIVWSDEGRSAILRTIGEEFTDEFGVTVTVETMGFGDIRDDLEVAGPVGEGPDIIIGAHDWLGQLVGSGLVAPMELGAIEDRFLPAAIQAYLYEGDLYGMPYQMDNVALVRNTDLVPEAPGTFSELTEIAARLEADGEVEYGFVRQEGDPYHFFPIMTAFGGYVFGMTDEGYDPNDVGLDSEGSLAAAEWLEMMVNEGHMTDGIDYGIMHGMFADGEAAMIITGPWALPEIRNSGVPYEISRIPGEIEPARPFLGVQGFMISAFSDQHLLAQTFITDFVATTDVMLRMYEAVPRPVVYQPAADLIDDEDIRAFAAAGEIGAPMPAIPQMSAVWEAWESAIVLITQGQLGGAEAFRDAAHQVREALGQ